jgi:hypothetical protein
MKIVNTGVTSITKRALKKGIIKHLGFYSAPDKIVHDLPNQTTCLWKKKSLKCWVTIKNDLTRSGFWSIALSRDLHKSSSWTGWVDYNKHGNTIEQLICDCMYFFEMNYGKVFA